MKIRKMLVLALCGILSLLTLSDGYAQELLNQEEATKPLFEKVYVSPDRIFVCSEGLFYLNEKGNLTSVHLISSDGSGLYILASVDAYQCPVCERWNRKNICQNLSCPLYGQ